MIFILEEKLFLKEHHSVYLCRMKEKNKPQSNSGKT